MIKAKVRFSLLALLLPLLLNASHILKNDLLNPQASKLIENMGNELAEKTDIHGYVIATNENFPVKFNLVTYSKKYEDNMSKPYVVLIFAANARLTEKSTHRGRIALIPSSTEVGKLYDKGDVIDATIDVVASKDKNTKEDKFNVGIVQGFSELADQIANAKNVKMTTTIPNDTRYIIRALQVVVIIGALLVFWMFLFRPIYMRIRHGKRK
ncbi:membrane protein [hydrothermal vent metagenome]|uniref:Membrane protein n=1 Tax=hydrothermal vent metagenome TaxID=652676 RepID=A0A1W1CQ02_9ZZZZ